MSLYQYRAPTSKVTLIIPPSGCPVQPSVLDQNPTVHSRSNADDRLLVLDQNHVPFGCPFQHKTQTVDPSFWIKSCSVRLSVLHQNRGIDVHITQPCYDHFTTTLSNNVTNATVKQTTLMMSLHQFCTDYDLAAQLG